MHSKVYSLILFFHLAQSVLIKRSTPETCASLRNEETYSSVKVQIGKPLQTMSLVADTGSDNLIVKDCSCEHCLVEWGKKCFSDPKNSKTFELPLFDARNYSKGSYPEKKKPLPARMVMSFGSGDIAINIASDEVQIGSLKTYLKNGLLLMVDHALEIQTHFEGILGLGRPNNQQAHRQGQPENVEIPGFFDGAGVQGFSMCFNRKSDGVLGINTPAHKNPMTAVGTVHWAMNFQGLSLGKTEEKIGFCNSDSTPCTIIPDSGTTFIGGPEQQLAMLFDSICKNWQKCKDTHRELNMEISKLKKKGIVVETAEGAQDLHQKQHTERQSAKTFFGRRQEEIQEVIDNVMARSPSLGNSELLDMKDEPDEMIGETLTLQLLMEHCTKWIEDVDLDEVLPKLHFHVAGANGNSQQLSISPRTYVMTKNAEVEVQRVQDILGFPFNVREKKQQKQVCILAFSPMEFGIPGDGDMWIFGTPLFYQYTAYYNRKDVSMGFTHRGEEYCGRCEGNSIIRQSEESLIGQDVGDHKRFGKEALHHISSKPLLRKVTAL